MTGWGHAEPVPHKRSPAHGLWAVLIASIYEVLALLRASVDKAKAWVDLGLAKDVLG